MACAEILFESSEESVRIGFNPVQGGVSLFHIRRQYILDIMRFLLIEAQQTDRRLSKLARRIVESSVVKNSLPIRVLEALKSVENELAAIEDKAKRGEFLGQSSDEQFLQTLKLRKDFSLQEHDVLGQILYNCVEAGLFGISECDKYLQAIKALSDYNSLIVHYIPAFFLLPRAQIGAISNDSGVHKEIVIAKVFKSLSDESSTWRMSYWANALIVVFGAQLVACWQESPAECKRLLNASNINNEESILTTVEKAIDNGGFEFLMALASDTSLYVEESLYQFQNYRSLLTAIVPQFSKLGQFTAAFDEILVLELEHIVRDVIVNLAGTLRTMRNNEEDIYMSQRRALELDLDEDHVKEQPGVDYERFLIFIASLYAGRPDQALGFWEDSDGDLHGFLEWATTSSPSSIMISSSSAMLSSLSKGNVSAQHAFELLSLNGILNHKTVQITWAAILTKVYECYAFVFKPDQKKDQMRALQDFAGIDGDASLILCSYFQLMNEVAAYNEDALSYLIYDANVGEPGEVELLLTFLVRLLKVQSSLYGPIMSLMSTLFKPLNSETRKLLWTVIDEWLFDSEIYTADTSVILKSSTIPVTERISGMFGTYVDLTKLISLLTSLLNNPANQSLDAGSKALAFPENLGLSYRQPGIWPYPHLVVGFIFQEFEVDPEDKSPGLGLKLSCLIFIEKCLDLGRIAQNWDSDNAPDVINFLKAHPFAYTMTCLFDSANYSGLFELAKLPIEAISDLSYDDVTCQTLVHALNIIVSILNTQHIFLDIAIKETKGLFSSHGVKSFEDALLYNLSSLSYFLLYCGSSNSTLALLSFKLLQFISLSPQFVTTMNYSRDSRVNDDRLLSEVMMVDESYRIREVFMNQLERDFDAYDDIPEGFYFEGVINGISGPNAPIQVKLNLLNFLIANLERKTSSPTISHYLLGFRIAGDGSLALDRESGGIGSGISLLHSIVNVLKNGISNVSPSRAGYESSLILSACVKIILLLTRKKNSSRICLEFLRKMDFFSVVLINEPSMLASAKWDGMVYSAETRKEFLESDSAATLAAFYQHRAAILECSSIEVYDSMIHGSLTLTEKYNEILLQSYSHGSSGAFGGSSIKILNFLDFLEFVDSETPGLENDVKEMIGPMAYDYFVSNEVSHGESNIEVACGEFERLLSLRGRQLIQSSAIESLHDANWVKARRTAISTFAQLKAKARLDFVQAECLESWSKLLLILLSGDRIGKELKSAFILEVFQSLSPKLLEYSSFKTRLTSILTSLLSSLIHIVFSGEGTTEADRSNDRTVVLFKTCLRVLQMKLTTPAIRKDLYSIGYLYLKSCLHPANNSSVWADQALQILRLSGDRTLSIACTDATSGDGSLQIPSLMFLQMLASVSSAAKSSFVLDGLLRYNLLALLIGSITSVGQTLLELASSSSRSKELRNCYSVFTQIFSFFIPVVQTRAGATQVVQAGLFDTLQQCGMLSIDPDVAFQHETGTHISSYAILDLIFQVVASILLSMGPENVPALKRTKKFLDENQRLVITTLRKDSADASIEDAHFEQLIKSQVLLVALTENTPS